MTAVLLGLAFALVVLGLLLAFTPYSFVAIGLAIALGTAGTLRIVRVGGGSGTER